MMRLTNNAAMAASKSLSVVKKTIRHSVILKPLVKIARSVRSKLKQRPQETNKDKEARIELIGTARRILKNANATKIRMGKWSVLQSPAGETKFQYRDCAFPILLLCKCSGETALHGAWTISESSNSNVVLQAKNERVNYTLNLELREDGTLLLSCRLMAGAEFFLQELSLLILPHKKIDLFDYIGRRRQSGAPALWLGRGLAQLDNIINVDLPTGSGFHYFNEGLVKIILEHGDAHPHMSFPFRQDETVEASYNSAIKMGAGAHAQYEVRFCPVAPVTPVALPWLHRDGYLATLILTEHACHTATPVHRAVYFGRSDIYAPEHSVGGLCKHRISITKSIHVTNRNLIANTGQSATFPGPMTSLDDSDFVSFVKSLKKSQPQIEICLHCADPESSTPEQTDAALEKLGDTATWIDHIWLRPTGNVTGCKEAYVCEGADPSSNAYMAPTWAKHGIRYFWNPVYEYKAPGAGTISAQIKGERFFRVHEEIDNGGLMVPLFWKSTIDNRVVWNWATFTVEQVGGSPKDWDNAFSQEALHDFCKWQGIYFSHAYPTYAGEQTWLVTQEENILKLEPVIDNLFARLAKFRKAGDIDCTTVRDFLGYAEALELVTVTPMSQGGHLIKYDGDENLTDFTLAVHTSRPIKIIGPQKVTHRKLDHMHLISFNLLPHSNVRVLMVPEGNS